MMPVASILPLVIVMIFVSYLLRDSYFINVSSQRDSYQATLLLFICFYYIYCFYLLYLLSMIIGKMEIQETLPRLVMSEVCAE